MKTVKRINSILLSLLLISLSSGQGLASGRHIVSPDQLRAAVVSAASKRQSNLETVDSFLRSPEVVKVLEGQPVPLEQIREAVPFLSDAELAQLAAQSKKIEHDIQAGALDNQQITYILIALITAVVVLVLTAD